MITSLRLKPEYLEMISTRPKLKGAVAEALSVQTRQLENIIKKAPERFMRLDILDMISQVAEVPVSELTER